MVHWLNTHFFDNQKLNIGTIIIDTALPIKYKDPNKSTTMNIIETFIDNPNEHIMKYLTKLFIYFFLNVHMELK